MGIGRRRAARSQAASASGHGHVIQVSGDGNTVCASSPADPMPMLRLPAEPVHLAGREKEAEAVLGLLAPSTRAPATPVVSVLCGLPGIGKTALALHVAHQAVARGWFPGGALFLHLRGHDPAGPVAAEEAVATLARALRVDDAMTADEQTGLCQAALNRLADEGRSVLLIADDASSAAQIERLVPARSTHRLLVTSRHLLTGPSFQARLVSLDDLEPRGAAALIAEALGHARPDDPRLTETDAIAELAGHCGHHPLALQIAASLLATDPGRSVVDLVAELADTHTRLDVLRYEDGGHTTAVQAAFHLSYQQLLAHHRQLFRQFALNPGPDTSTDAAAALWGQPRARTRNGLAALARAGLLAEQPGGLGALADARPPARLRGQAGRRRQCQVAQRGLHPAAEAQPEARAGRQRAPAHLRRRAPAGRLQGPRARGAVAGAGTGQPAGTHRPGRGHRTSPCGTGPPGAVAPVPAQPTELRHRRRDRRPARRRLRPRDRPPVL
ncbi:NB-ARC domain-containing protein [Streptomyces sp. NPDC007984]|uniref:NB-ARC domain-containing protein n=1 Tax=Streptomyces sp. NPDC007984 TaxID=3364801 RepID=UPI0036E623E4